MKWKTGKRSCFQNPSYFVFMLDKEAEQHIQKVVSLMSGQKKYGEQPAPKNIYEVPSF